MHKCLSSAIAYRAWLAGPSIIGISSSTMSRVTRPCTLGACQGAAKKTVRAPARAPRRGREFHAESLQCLLPRVASTVSYVAMMGDIRVAPWCRVVGWAKRRCTLHCIGSTLRGRAQSLFGCLCSRSPPRIPTASVHRHPVEQFEPPKQTRAHHLVVGRRIGRVGRGIYLISAHLLIEEAYPLVAALPGYVMVERIAISGP